jgi:hypothetical protein
MKKKLLHFSLSLTLLCVSLLSACNGVPKANPTEIPILAANETPTIASTPLPEATATQGIISVSSANWKMVILGADWIAKSGNLTAKAGFKLLRVQVDLEYVGPEADLTPTFSATNENGLEFERVSQTSTGTDNPSDILGWILNYLMDKPTARHFMTGDKISVLLMVFGGPDDSKKFFVSFGDLPMVEITNIVVVK